MAWIRPILMPWLCTLATIISCAAALHPVPHIGPVQFDAQLPQRQTQPSVFVGIFSRRGDALQRSLVRDMWRNAAQGELMKTTYRYVLCNRSDDNLAEQLKLEQMAHSDLMVLDCAEGQRQGMLTRKMATLMSAYILSFDEYSMLMKVEDNSFVAWNRLAKVLLSEVSGDGAANHVGVSATPRTACRDPYHQNYEPFFAFQGYDYPQSMHSGAGFLLGRQLVKDLLVHDIPDKHNLWNEDRAAGVWLSALATAGGTYQTTEVAGYFRGARQQTSFLRTNLGSVHWQDYPFLLHHGLQAETIACLALADFENRLDRSISHCWDFETGSDEGDPALPDCISGYIEVETEWGKSTIVK